MQRAIVTVLLAGDMLNTAVKTGVSPAEILLLRHIHGDDAVTNITAQGNDRGKVGLDEKDRLKRAYSAKAFTEVFPGAAPKLPDTLKEIGINGHSDAPQKAAGKAKGASTEIGKDDAGDGYQPGDGESDDTGKE